MMSREEILRLNGEYLRLKLFKKEVRRYLVTPMQIALMLLNMYCREVYK